VLSRGGEELRERGFTEDLDLLAYTFRDFAERDIYIYS
jgi:hypothetical protein